MIKTTFEERFEELVDILPPHKNAGRTDEFKIRFDWGSQEQLNQFMLLPESISKYPLIWLVENKYTEDRVRNEISGNAKIIIATQSIGVSRNNREIYNQEYKGILNPVKNNLITAIEKSGIARLPNELYVSRIQEYSWNNENKENATGDVWMVIFIEGEIKLSTNKIINQNIKF